MISNKKTILLSLLIPIPAAILIALFFFLSPETHQRLEYLALDRLFTSSYNPEKSTSGAILTKSSNAFSSEPVVILGIDKTTLETMKDKPFFKDKDWNSNSWPFDRRVMAEAITRLKSMKAAVVGVDILYTLEKNPTEDQALADAIKNAGNVVLAALFEETANEEIVYKKPPELFSNAASGTGFVNVPTDTDGILRKVLLRHKTPEGKQVLPFFVQCWNQYPFNRGYVPSSMQIRNQTAIIPPQDNNFPDKMIHIFKDHTGLKKMLIHYKGPAKSYLHISFSDLFDPERKEELSRLLKGKIVLIGVTHAGLQDLYMTPFYSYDQKWTAGVECHANAIQTLMTDKSIAKLPYWQIFLYFYILAIALTFCTSFARVSFSFALLSLEIITIMGLCFFLFQSQLYLDFWQPFFGLLFSYVMIISSRMIAREKEKATIRKVFNQYVSNHVVDELLLHPDNLSLGGKSLEISTLFSDVRGFTTLSENKSPEEVVALLNSYFELMVAVITKYNGTINKFIGDAIMVLYGAPVLPGNSPEKMAENAVRTAIEMQETMKSSADPRLKLIQMGIGITTGHSVVGNIGAKKHKDYTAIGDRINLAARLESRSKAYEIIVDAKTWEYTNKIFEYEQLEPFQVKGKSEWIQAYRVIY
jgi:adenylate cyclase